MTTPDTRTDDRSRAAWKAFDSASHVASDGETPLHRAAIIGVRTILQVASPSILGATFELVPQTEDPSEEDRLTGRMLFVSAYGAGGQKLDPQGIDGLNYREFIARLDEYLSVFTELDDAARYFDSYAIPEDGDFAIFTIHTDGSTPGPDRPFFRSSQTVQHLAASLTNSDAEALIEALLARPHFVGLAYSRTAVVNDLNDIRADGGLELIEDISDASWTEFRDGEFARSRFDMDVTTRDYIGALRALPEGKAL